MSLPLGAAVLAFLASAPSRPAPADEPALVLHALFQDRMVLQRDRPLPVTGKARSEWVEVELGPARARAAVDGERFCVELPAQPAGGPHVLVVRGADGAVEERRDVLIGDVWLVAGQSNAAMVLAATGEELPAQDDALGAVRGLTVEPRLADRPVEELGGRWAVLGRETAPGFSALGVHFGRRMHELSGVAQGIVVAALADSTGEGWVSRAALLEQPLLAARVADYERAVLDQERLLAEHERALADFESRRREALAAGRDAPRRAPRPPLGPDHPKRPCALREGMIAPLAALPIRGVVWYQGEGNASRAEEYAGLLGALVGDWRRAWRDPALPFLVVQLPALGDPAAPTPGNWARLREAQRRAAAELSGVGLAVTLDLGDESDIHPVRKREVAERVAVLAERVLAGAPPGASGPVPFAFRVVDGGLAIDFADVEGGGLAGAALAGFELHDERGWHAADAVASGATVVARASGVPAPIAVRYAWHDGAHATLRDLAGRVASPFSSDPRALAPPR